MSGGSVVEQLKHRDAATCCTSRGSRGPVMSRGGRGPWGLGRSSRKLLPSRSESTSGVTSKPAIEGHFKTGQRTSSLDDLFYLTGWRSGKCNLVQPVCY